MRLHILLGQSYALGGGAVLRSSKVAISTMSGGEFCLFPDKVVQKIVGLAEARQLGLSALYEALISIICHGLSSCLATKLYL